MRAYGSALEFFDAKRTDVPASSLISIIDDDGSMRNAPVALVRSAGYDAKGFASAEQFLGDGTIESYPRIVTDIQMPGMSGIECKHHVSASQVYVPVIMIIARHDHRSTRPGS